MASSAFGSSTLMSGATKPGGDKSGSGGSKKKTSFRIEVNLFEPDADSFPEFNFRQLLLVEKVRGYSSRHPASDRINQKILVFRKNTNERRREAMDYWAPVGSTWMTHSAGMTMTTWLDWRGRWRRNTCVEN